MDKMTRSLVEWRSAEAKSKRQSHAAARENEKLQDAALETRSDRALVLSYYDLSMSLSVFHFVRYIYCYANGCALPSCARSLVASVVGAGI